MNPDPAASGSTAPGNRRPWVVALAFLVLAGALAGGWWLLRGEPSPVPTPVAEPAPTTPPQAESPVEPAPAEPLNAVDADTAVRERLMQLSSDSTLEQWLGGEDLVRRLTAAIMQISEGQSPRTLLSFLAPKGELEVVQRGAVFTISPKSYARYDRVTDILTAIDPERAASGYRELRRFFESAFREIGRPGKTFDATLTKALDRLLAVEPLTEETEVVPKGLVYGYADESLEAADAAQKHLLRMGPRNAAALQAWIRKFEAARR